MCLTFDLGDEGKPIGSVCKKGPECSTEIVVISGFIGIPVALATTKAELMPSTSGAFSRVLLALFKKTGFLFSVEEAFQRLLTDFTEVPIVQTVEVTGIKRTITFYDEISSTASADGTGAGGKSHSKVDVIIKQADASVVSTFPVQKPFIEQAA